MENGMPEGGYSGTRSCGGQGGLWQRIVGIVARKAGLAETEKSPGIGFVILTLPIPGFASVAGFGAFGSPHFRFPVSFSAGQAAGEPDVPRQKRLAMPLPYRPGEVLRGRYCP